MGPGFESQRDHKKLKTLKTRCFEGFFVVELEISAEEQYSF